MKIYLLLSCLISTASSLLFAQPTVILDNQYGTALNEFSRTVKMFSDSLFVIAGETENQTAGGYDISLTFASIYGGSNTLTYGFAQNDRMQEAKDNALQVLYSAPGGPVDGFLMVGTTESYTVPTVHGAGGQDIYLIRTDQNGNELWHQTYGGLLNDRPRVVRQTSDGGFIIVAETESFGVSGGTDVYLVKTDANGVKQWDFTYHLTGNEGGNDVVELSGGGYLVLCSGSHLFRVQSTGIPDSGYGTFPAASGASSTEDSGVAFNYNTIIPGGNGHMFDPLPGGGYIACGTIVDDSFLARLDASGNVLGGWPITISRPGNNFAYAVHPILDITGIIGYIVAGETDGQGALGTDGWLMRTDALGNFVWDGIYGGIGNEDFTSFIVDQDNFKYILTGKYTTASGDADTWLLILEDPSLFAFIEGTTFHDINNNCQYDPGVEPLLQNQIVKLQPGPYFGITDGAGKYSFKVPYGTYFLSILPNNFFQPNPCLQPSATPITVTGGQTSLGNDFLMEDLLGSPCASGVQIVSAPFATSFCANAAQPLASPCPGAPHVYRIYLNNRANQNSIDLSQSTLEVILPEGMNFTGLSFIIPGAGGSFSAPITSTQGLHQVLTWNSTNMSGYIPVLGQALLRCTVFVQTSPIPPLPYTIEAEFNASCTAQNNHTSNDLFSQSNSCSCDPNDKLVSPKGCGPDGRIAFGQALTYRVRFENVGTGPAHDVMIRDVLDSDFDPLSLQMLGSDHTFTIQIDPGNELVIHFTGIELQPNATGEVFFSLDHLPGLPEGTTLTNSAEIYFDLNPPVITNTELNTLYNDPGITYDTWYKDQDNDGYSDGTTQQSCVQPNGYKLSGNLIATSGDCDDSNGGINPAASEVCNGIDDDCNTQIDEFFTNFDGDNMADCVDADDDNDGELDATDCDDFNPSIRSGAPEICNGLDDDCDGSVDEGVVPFSTGLVWQNTIGGSSWETFYALQQTSDGGYILGGESYSYLSGDKTENVQGQNDYWVVKLDAAGTILWQNNIGGNAFDALKSVQQTSDGGYILAGDSNSDISGDKTENSQGGRDYWVVKLDASGNIVWQNTIGGSGEDILNFVQQTGDGGYILGGNSASPLSGDKTENTLGFSDAWVVKLDASGTILWQNTLGGNETEGVYSLQQTSDGGYILGAYSDSDITGDKTEISRGSFDYWAVKLDAVGNLLWQKTIGGIGEDILKSIRQTGEGGYILAGNSASNISGDKTENSEGGKDYWVVKLDAFGNLLWQNAIGGSGEDVLNSIRQTSDGGYLLGGYSDSGISGDKTQNSQGGNDYWAMKLNATGNLLWQKTIGGSNDDYLLFAHPTNDGLYILGGYSNTSISGDKTENSQGSFDFWVVKLGPVEICDGIDNDCDGQIDEGNVCCPAGNILYVKANATGNNNGTSWVNAFTDLQSALALNCPNITQIWVAAGTYKPTTSPNPTISFVMKNNLAIYGGFTGTETLLSQRNWVSNVTILSGELGTAGNNFDNSFHVMANINNGLNSSAILDGFTITGGINAFDTSFPNNSGGGMLNLSSSPSLANCTFFGNSNFYGGGMNNYAASPNLVNCIFSGNSGTYGGGGMYNHFLSPSLVNCTFSGNTAGSNLGGGGMFNDNTSPSLTNCTFSGNLSPSGGGMQNVISSSPSLTNCIFWGNSSQMLNQSSAPVVSHSIVQGGCPVGAACTNVQNVDPLFVSQPPVALGTSGDLHLQVCSPAIDAGDDASNTTTSDLAGNPRKVDAITGGNIIDLGPYEFQGTVLALNVTLNPFPSVCLTAPAFSLTGGLPTGGTYSGPGVSAGQFNPATAGTGTHTITYSYTDANNCTGTATQMITVNALPTVTLANFSPVCVNAAAFLLTGGSPAGGTYSGPGISAGQFNPATAGTGTHTIIYSYMDANNCAGTATKTITVNAAPTVTLANFAQVCLNTPPFALTGGLPTGGTYSGKGVSAGQFNGSVAGVGTHTITYSYTNANNCTGTATNTITVNALPTVTIAGFSPVCVNAAAFLLTNGSPAGGTYSGPGVSAGQFNPATAGTGTHTITYSYTNANNCTGTATKTITVNAAPTIANAGADRSTCQGSSVTLAGNAPTVGTGSWSVSSGPSTASSQFSSLANPTATFTPTGGPGTYQLQWSIANSPCPASTDILVLSVVASPTVSTPGNQTVCSGSPTAAVNFSGSPGAGFTWTCSDPSIGLPASGMGNIASFTALNNGTIPKVATITVTPQVGGLAYIPNAGSNHISVVNIATNSVIASVPTPGGTGANGICVSKDASRVYIANTTSNNVTVLNTATNSVSYIPTPGGIGPHGICINSDGSRVYVGNIGSNNVSVINTTTNAVSLIPTFAGGSPHGVCISTNDSRVYVTNINSNNISVINTLTNAVTTIPIPSSVNLHGICPSPDGSRVYVTNLNSNHLSIINTATNVVSNISIPYSGYAVCTNPDGSRVYVAHHSNQVSAINTVTNAVTNIPIPGSTPWGVSITSDGSRVYVSNQGSDNVSVINTATNSVIGNIGVGNTPQAYGNFITGTTCTDNPVTFTITVQDLIAPDITCPQNQTIPLASTWQPVGTPGFSAGLAYSLSLAFSGTTPYVAYQDDVYGLKATVMKFDGTNWVNVGTPGFSAGQANHISLATLGSTPYVAYGDDVNGGKARVMKFDGTNWVNVGTPGFSAGPAGNTSIAFSATTPYVAYLDVANGFKATVMKFDGTNWVNVGTPGFSAGSAYYISLAFSGTTPYIVYSDGSNSGKAAVMKFDGTNWVNVGTPGFSAGQAYSLSLASSGATPYVAYRDEGNAGKAMVMKFDGTNWVNVGTPGISAGVAHSTSLAFSGTTPYVAYIDEGDGGGNKVMVMKFDGTNWVSVGTPGLLVGLTFGTSIAFSGTTLYMACVDGCGAGKPADLGAGNLTDHAREYRDNCQVSVLKFDGVNCDALLGDWTNSAITTDNCTPSANIAVSQAPFASTLLSGDNDLETVTLTADDGNGNTASCSFTVTLQDMTPPVITCPQNQIITADANCQGLINSWEPASLGDNCTALNNIIVVQTVTPSNFSGINDVLTATLTADDGNGNSANCSFTVTLKDLTPPTVACKNLNTQLNASGNLTIAPAQVYQSGADNCGTVSLVGVSPNLLTCGNLGNNTVTLTVNDSNGNQVTCSATVNISPFIVINSVTVTNETCKNASNGSITINASSCPGTLMYSINGGASYLPSTNIFNNLPPGNYSIKVYLQGWSNPIASSTAIIAAGPLLQTWYKDFDNDGYSDGVTQSACTQPANFKLLAQLTAPPTGTNIDCNDNSSVQRPGQTWYKDQDNDGYGATGTTPIVQCTRPLYYKATIELTQTTGDCQDGTTAVTGYPNVLPVNINPGKPEICNSIDDDCDGVKDEGLSGITYTPNPVTVVLTSQALVNSWPPCYTKINGNLTISGVFITSLAALANLTEVTGTVTIQSANSLTNLNGLNGLTTIGGNLTIKSNNLLNSIAALGNLTSVGGNLDMQFNPLLTSLTGLGKLTSIVGFFQIKSNNLLSNLNGLNSSLTIGGNLNVTLNFQLSNCCAIEHFLVFGGLGGVPIITGNKPPGNCNSPTQILTTCPLFDGGGSENLTALPCPDCPAGVDESQPPSLSLFPNPATDEVMVSLSETLSEDGFLRLYDAQGRLVFQQKTAEGEQSWTLSLADGKITNGLYLVALENRGKVLVERLVVQ